MREKPPRVPQSPPADWLQYRVYFFNGGTHIVKSHEFQAVDHAAAINFAEGRREGRTIELWQRNRMVKRWAQA